MSLDSDVKAGIKHLESLHKAFDGKILLFGPGDPLGKKNRQNLIRRLRRRGFEACTSEQLSKKTPSFLNAYQQESVHWRLFDIILIFNYGVGVGQEVAGYAHDPAFREKAFVLYPPRYDPTISPSYGT